MENQKLPLFENLEALSCLADFGSLKSAIKLLESFAPKNLIEYKAHECKPLSLNYAGYLLQISSKIYLKNGDVIAATELLETYLSAYEPGDRKNDLDVARALADVSLSVIFYLTLNQKFHKRIVRRIKIVLRSIEILNTDAFQYSADRLNTFSERQKVYKVFPEWPSQS